MEKVSIGLGIVNGGGTIALFLVTPIYGVLVDVTGGYSFSNLILIVNALVMTGILVLFASACLLIRTRIEYLDLFL